MKIEREQLFRTLDPPAGGRARLRARLESEANRGQKRRLRLVVAGVAASALLAVFVIVRWPDSTPSPESAPVQPIADSLITAPDAADDPFAAAAFDRLLGRPFTPVPLQVSLNDEPLTAVELASGNRSVRIYELSR